MIDGERKRHGVKDPHPGVLAHPGLADRREMPGEFGEAGRDRLGDPILGGLAGLGEGGLVHGMGDTPGAELVG